MEEEKKRKHEDEVEKGMPCTQLVCGWSEDHQVALLCCRKGMVVGDVLAPELNSLS